MNLDTDAAAAFLDTHSTIMDIAICEFAGEAGEAGFSDKEAAALVSYACKDALFASFSLIPDDWEEHKAMFRRLGRQLRLESIATSNNRHVYDAACKAKKTVGGSPDGRTDKTCEAQPDNIE